MAKLLNFKSKRTQLQTATAGFALLLTCLLLSGAIPTQWFAAQYGYTPRLGEALIRIRGFAIYLPLDWMLWGLKYGDYPHLKAKVHTMLFLGSAGVIASIIAAVIAVQAMARRSKGMDSLHGSAHFAEWEDIDQTGFVDSGAHKAKGVVVGSVILDRKGKVIHPHHPKFDRRYKVRYKPRNWKNRFKKEPLRDSNNRVMFAVRKTVVKAVELLRDGGNTHLFGFCPTRSGKGVGFVIPTLLTWEASVMVNDPKGEAFALTAGFRKAAGQNIIKLQPACTDGSAARWNPLGEIRIFTLHDVGDAQMIMSMACDPEGKGLEDYFDKAGYEFLTALALHVRYVGNDGSLAGVAKFLGDPNWDSDKQMYLEMMQAQHDPEGKMGWEDTLGNPTRTHPMIANAAKTMLNKEDKDRSGVLSTAKSLLSLYLDPIVARNTSTSDFLVRDLMTGERPISLYYVVESADMERMTPLTRLFYSLFIRRNAVDMEFKDGRSVASYSHPLLCIIDEAASLKKLPILQEALGYVAGYGIRMFFLVQDIAQVEELYGQHQSFDSGAETRVAYAPNKIETAEKLARMTGKTTVTEDNASSSGKLLGIDAGSVSLGTNKTARDLITADEMMALHDQDLILFIKGQPPIYGRKAFYYENPVLLARAKIPPPDRSSVLRSNPPQVEAQSMPPAPTHLDKWAAGRAAVQARRSAAIAPQTPSSETGRSATDDRRANSTERPRSRYTDKATTKMISPEERQRIQRLIEDKALVDKVATVAAF